MFSLIWSAFIGLIIGAVAKLIVPGKDPGGIWITILLGIAGSFLASWIGQAAGWYQQGQSAGFIVSILGAILILSVYHLVRRQTTT